MRYGRADLKIPYLLVMLILALFGFSFDHIRDGYIDWQEDRQLAKLHAEIATLCLQRDTSEATVPDKLRHCVHSQTQFGIGEQFYAAWKDKVSMTQSVLDYMKGYVPDKKQFECSTRSGLLVGLLRSQGYKARDVITAKFRPEFSDHVIVSVWDPQANDWGAQDPSHDVSFRDIKTGEHLSMQEMVTKGTDHFHPCRYDGACGWHLSSDEGISFSQIKDYWGNMVIKNGRGDWQIVYNPDYFDPQKPLAGETYCQKREKFCRVSPLSSGELNNQAKRL